MGICSRLVKAMPSVCVTLLMLGQNRGAFAGILASDVPGSLSGGECGEKALEAGQVLGLKRGVGGGVCLDKRVNAGEFFR